MNVEHYLTEVLDVNQQDLDHAREAARANNTSLEHELHAAGLISHAEYSQMLAHTHGITFVSLTAKHVAPESFTRLAEPLSRTLRSVVFNVKDGVPQVATESLTDELQQELEMHLDTFDLFITDDASISKVLGTYQTYLREHYGERITDHARKLQAFESYEYEGDVLPTRYISELQDSFDAIKITELLFSVMQTMQARDIYIDRGINNTEISMRFGARILPTINLDVHIFDRLLWVYAKQADVDIQHMRGPLHTVHLPTPQHNDLHARITFVTTNESVSHIHINAEDSSQLFPTIEALFPSARQSQALIHQLSAGHIMLASNSDFQRKRLYYGVLEKMSHLSKRVTSIEEHVEVNIPEVMQLNLPKKRALPQVIVSAESLRSDVIGFSQQLADEEVYKKVTGRHDYNHVFSFNTVRNAVKVLQAFRHTKPVGLISQVMFDTSGDVVMRTLSPDHKAALQQALKDTVHTLDLSQEFAHASNQLHKKSIKSKAASSTTVQGLVMIMPYQGEVLFETVSRNIKASVVEHALMRSSQGEISIEEIVSYIAKP